MMTERKQSSWTTVRSTIIYTHTMTSTGGMKSVLWTCFVTENLGKTSRDVTSLLLRY